MDSHPLSILDYLKINGLPLRKQCLDGTAYHLCPTPISSIVLGDYICSFLWMNIYNHFIPPNSCWHIPLVIGTSMLSWSSLGRCILCITPWSFSLFFVLSRRLAGAFLRITMVLTIERVSIDDRSFSGFLLVARLKPT